MCPAWLMRAAEEALAHGSRGSIIAQNGILSNLVWGVWVGWANGMRQTALI
ncbi:MAG: hypothetical protein H0U76_30410 [Ktedonobacteraceae bacterium]|nr:hypothetical protein [Ktedonobacteraceae bacterium]